MRGHEGRAFLPLLVWIACDVGIDLVTEELAGSHVLIQELLSASVRVLVDVYFLAFALLLYLDARIRSEDFDLEILARRIDLKDRPSTPAAR